MNPKAIRKVQVFEKSIPVRSGQAERDRAAPSRGDSRASPPSGDRTLRPIGHQWPRSSNRSCPADKYLL